MNKTQDINYWLIPMNYEYCDFKILKDEYSKNEIIKWKAPGTPKGQSVNNITASSLKKDDVVYFYVTNLPSEKNERLSRILLRGVVKEQAVPMKNTEVYSNPIEEKMINVFSIGSITTLNMEQLVDNSFLCRDYLVNNNRFHFSNPQGEYWPNKKAEKEINKLDNKLITELDREFTGNNNFDALIKHFERRCFFCGKIGSESEHKTFKGRNYLDYYEYHHFIMQSLAKANKHPELEGIVNDPYNGLHLCSNCHNKIHYGTIESIAEMIEEALKDKNIKAMLNDNRYKDDFRQVVGLDLNKSCDDVNEDDIKRWFVKVYTSNKN